jgi:hypothetical protein
MGNMKEYGNGESTFEEQIRGFLEQGKEKLMKELEGTRGAIKLLAQDKARDFMRTTDIGFSKEERELLSEMIVSSMYQSFCYGYGIGKMEGSTKRKIYL